MVAFMMYATVPFKQICGRFNHSLVIAGVGYINEQQDEMAPALYLLTFLPKTGW
jgi:hypothetical protein